jgi:hypothetical protein
MAGHGEKLTRNQERSIAALLISPTLADAASRAGVHVNSLRNWLRQPAFAAAFADARKELLTNAVGRLQHAVFAASDRLVADLDDEAPDVRLRAAELLLGTAVRASEMLRLAEQVETLEKALESRKELTSKGKIK